MAQEGLHRVRGGFRARIVSAFGLGSDWPAMLEDKVRACPDDLGILKMP